MHTYNPSYSGDKDLWDLSSRPAPAKSYPVPISTNWGQGQGAGSMTQVVESLLANVKL
jgi:hypothetical protein